MVNVDDPYGARLAGELPDAVTFALEQRGRPTARATSRPGLTGSRFTVHGPDGVDRAELAAARAVQRLQRARRARRRRARSASPPATSTAAIETAGQVPGRFEPVDAGQEFAVLVDYAHTPDSLENVLRRGAAS